MSQLPDNELMLGVMRGQLHLMGEIYERHHQKVFNFLIKQTGNRQLSEDLMQETFERVLKYASGFKADAQFTTWLFSISRNVCNNYWKKQLRESSALADLEVIEDPKTNPEFLKEIREESRLLQIALLKLPYEQRELILLAKVKQLSGSDLSKIYECSTNTLKVRLHRALTNLRLIMVESEEPSENRQNEKNYGL